MRVVSCAYDVTIDTQFLSRDPAVATTRQPYSYVNDNPLNASDPSGLCGWTDPFGCVSDAAGHVAGGVSAAAHAVGSQAVSWAGDIHNALPNCTIFDGNCSPVIKSASICANAGVFGGIGIMGNVCIGETNGYQHGGLTYSGGYGFGAGAGVSGGIAVSNATCLQDYGGPFAEGGGGAGPFSASVQGGAGMNGQLVIVGYGGLSTSTPEGYVGANKTGVWQWW